MSEERRREKQDETPREPDIKAGRSFDGAVELTEADESPEPASSSDKPKPDPPIEQRLEP